MQIKFDIEEVMIMDALIGDAVDAAQGSNRDVYRYGKRLQNKLAINAEFLNLKISEMKVILEMLKDTLGMAGRIDESKDLEGDKENREANIKIMKSALKKLEEKINA